MLHADARYGPPEPAATGRLMRENPFALLVTVDGGEPWFTHLPVLVDGPDEAPTHIRMHVARINPHWRHFGPGSTSSVVFQGPHSYVSPTTYTTPLTRAPTWNYAVVHAHGPVRLLEEVDAVDRVIDELALVHERDWPEQWDPAAYDPDRRRKLRPAIVAFAMEVERLEPRFKLNQHNSPADRLGTIRGLMGRPDPGAHGVARLMQATLADEE